MKNFVNMYRTFIRIAPFGVLITVLYFLLDAVCPALITVLFENIFQGLSLLIDGGSAEIFTKSILYFLMLRLLWYLTNYGYSILVNTSIFEKGTFYFRIALREKTACIPLLTLECVEVQEMKRKAERAVDEEALPMMFYQTLSTMSAALATILVAVVLARYHVALFMVALLTVCPYLVIQVLRGKAHNRIKNAQAGELRKADYYWSLLTDKDSVKELRMLGCGAYISDLWKKSDGQVKQELWREEQRDIKGKTGCSLLQLAGYFCAVFLTMFLITTGKLQAHIFGAVVAAVSSMQNTTRFFLESAGEFPELFDIMQNYYEFIQMKEEEKGGKEKKKLREGIVLENVSFTYPENEKELLSQINMKIHAGEKIAIVGENGSGKTTLGKVLLGVYPPDKGKVLWDDFCYQEFGAEELYQRVSVVSQNFVKYYLTLRENVAVSDVKRIGEDSHIYKCLKHMEAECSIPLDEQLGSEYGGAELSGGQWQRLSIARGVFRDSDFILLDEPTSSIDPITEAAVFSNFLKAAEKQTAVIITHRIGICQNVDRIIVLKAGKIVEVGSHKELLQKNGEYARMYNAQAAWYI